MKNHVERLVAVAIEEWEFFGRSEIRLDGTSFVGRKEYEDGAWQRVGDYWKFIGGAYGNLNGKDRGYPWSAAFISWCMDRAGAAAQFPYSAGHSTYINKAIRNSEAGHTQSPILGHRTKNYKLEVGDLIGYWWGDEKITYDNATKVGWYHSHTEVVIEIGRGFAFCIGGNVLHSVTKRAVKIGSAGDLVDSSKNWFVAIQNNIQSR